MRAIIEYTATEANDIGIINDILSGGKLGTNAQFTKTTNGGTLSIEGTQFELREAFSNIRPPKYADSGVITKKVRLNNVIEPDTTILEIITPDGQGGHKYTIAKGVDLKHTEYHSARPTGIFRLSTLGINNGESVRLRGYRTEGGVRFFVIE